MTLSCPGSCDRVERIMASRRETISHDSCMPSPDNYALTSHPRSISPGAFKRDEAGSVLSIRNDGFEWSGEQLQKAFGRTFYYDGTNSLVAGCPDGVLPTDASKCTLKLGDDLWSVNGQAVMAVRMEGRIIGVIYKGSLYPVITDHLGSVRAMLHYSTGNIIWERQYGPWGSKRVLINPALDAAGKKRAAELEAGTVWSFAGLVELPGVESNTGHPVYWSRTRAYSSELHEWMSVDPVVKWNPRTLLDKPGNWHAVRYAAGRPMEYSDTTGAFTEFYAYNQMA